jgi:hypothetical protein
LLTPHEPLAIACLPVVADRHLFVLISAEVADQFGGTPLHYAALDGFSDISRLLIAAGG